jgi:hypothetical protein
MNKRDFKQSFSLPARGDCRELIKHLAREQFLQEKRGTNEDFERLRREAFPPIWTIDDALKKPPN